MPARANVRHEHRAQLRLHRLAGVLAVSLAAAACGTTKDPPPEPVTSPTLPAVTTTYATTPSTNVARTTVPSPASTSQRWTYTDTRESGDVIAVELQVSKAYPFGSAPSAGSHTFAEAGCPANPQRDALMIGSLKATSKSPNGFSQKLDAALYAGTKGGASPVFNAALFYGSSTKCVQVGYSTEGGTDGITVQSNDQMTAGQSLSFDFYIILNDVYTPAHPKGVLPVNGVYLLPYGGTIANVTGPNESHVVNAPDSAVCLPLAAAALK